MDSMAENNRENILEKKNADKPRYSAETLQQWKEENDNVIKERQEIAKKNNKMLEAFCGNKEMLLYLINNYHRINFHIGKFDSRVFESLMSFLANQEYESMRWEERREFLKGVNKPKTVESLEKRLHEAYDYLKIPVANEIEIIDRMIDYDRALCQQYLDRFMDHFYVFAKISGNPEKMIETYEHSARLALYSIKISEFMGFDENYKTKFFCSALLHDNGKFASFNHPEGSEKNDKIPLDHPMTGAFFTDPLDWEVSSIIGLHHAYQKDSYKDKNSKETAETIYLSKLLAISDFYDSASTRKNGRLLDFTDKMLLRKLPAKNKVKEKLMESYGNLDLVYSGELLPHIDAKGHLLIDTFYSNGIFGHKSPINPFQEKESFKFNFK